MKNFYFFILVVSLHLSFNLNVKAQQDSLKDLFPLSVGNKWIYSFNTGDANSLVHFRATDTGTGEYEITGCDSSGGRIIWHFFQRRQYTEDVYQTYTKYVRDSAAFDIVEVNSGRHILYSQNFDFHSIFPFVYSDADSNAFFRFITTSSSADVLRNIRYKDASNPSPQNDWVLQTKLRPDAGIVSLNGSKSDNMSWSWSTYSLQAFYKAYPYPHLRFQQTSVFLNAVAGTPTDTTINIFNDGIKTLTIKGFTSSNPDIEVTRYSDSIPPLAQGSITIRFGMSSPGTANGELHINSNSVNTDDTVFVSGRTYEPAEAEINPRSIYFGSVRAGAYRDSTISVTNRGTESIYLTLSFDHPYQSYDFVIDSQTKEIKPGSTLIEPIKFIPVNSDPVSMIIKFNFSKPPLGTVKVDSVLLQGNLSNFLSQNYPNPFNGTAKINLQLNTFSRVSIKIFDILGRQISTLADKQLAPGNYEWIFNANGLASGIYFYRIQAGGYTQTRKMLLLK